MEAVNDQDKMDALVAELAAEQARLSGEGAPGDTSDDGDLNDQDKMDALVAQLAAENGGATSADPPAATAEPDDPAEGGDQDKMDALVAQLATENDGATSADPPAATAEPDDPAEGGDQDKMDALVAQLAAENGGMTAEEAASEVDDPEASDESMKPHAVGQGRMDSMLAELGVKSNGPIPVEKSVAADEAPAESRSSDAPEDDGDADEMAALVAKLQADTPESAADDSEFAGLDDDEMLLDAYGKTNGADAENAAERDEPSSPDDTDDSDFSGLDDDEILLDAYGETSAANAAPVVKEKAVAPSSDDGTISASPPKTAVTPSGDVPDFRKPAKRVQALKEKTRPSPRRRWRWAGVALAGIVLAAGVFGWRIRHDGQVMESTKTPPGVAGSPAAGIPPARVDVTEPPPASDPLADRFRILDTLRDDLLAKQAEIYRLKADYAQGIEEVSVEVVEEMTASRVGSFKAAMKNPRIAYGLQTIQQREAYIAQLAAPLRQLTAGSEALLYERRRAEIDQILLPLVAGMDQDGLVARVDAAIAKYRIDTEPLVSRPPASGSPSLESIYGPLEARARRSPKALSAATAAPPVVNHAIADEICRGNFDQKFALQVLDSSTAACVTRWSGKELFLNRIRSLTPTAAAELAHWKGQWLGLNAIRRLSTGAAVALFAWDGERLSLNGLEELPVGASAAIARWPGRQLELMGLEVLSTEAAEAISRWTHGGGHVFLPQRFYRQGGAADKPSKGRS